MALSFFFLIFFYIFNKIVKCYLRDFPLDFLFFIIILVTLPGLFCFGIFLRDNLWFPFVFETFFENCDIFENFSPFDFPSKFCFFPKLFSGFDFPSKFCFFPKLFSGFLSFLFKTNSDKSLAFSPLVFISSFHSLIASRFCFFSRCFSSSFFALS